MANSFYNNHLLSVDSLSVEDMMSLFHETDTMKEIVTTKGATDILEGKIIAGVFFEPSTRTFASFMSAAQRLGAGIVPFHGMMHSSINKGESLEDTMKTLGCSSDLIVLRHPEEGSVAKVAPSSYVPIINGGDGGGEHPTQSLLEAYTIYNKFKTFENLTVGLRGDLQHSRTIRSLSKVLAKLGVKKIIWISPESLKMGTDVKEVITSHNIELVETPDITAHISELDVLYLNRIQKERFADEGEYEKVKHSFITTPQTIEKAKASMIILDPLPRIEEIDVAVDKDPRALYLKEQMQNGLYTRMALLKMILTP